MSPTWKYMLGRIGLFVGLGAVLIPTGLSLAVIAMIALLGSFLLSLVLLRRWRVEMVEDVDKTVQHRRKRKDELRRQLAGEDEDD
ncbi:MAG TPA: DUF4229 domain-containing protein [Candidatus Stackebrandtia excrementipullorum]|nr:DUF4229 domain-containing protein [Candidatus Stackebrandtia excrementipullorum]